MQEKIQKNPHEKFENKQKLPLPRKYNLPKHTEDIENLKRCLMIKDGQPRDNNLPFKNKQKNQWKQYRSIWLFRHLLPNTEGRDNSNTV